MTMKKSTLGVLLGTFAGIIDVIPMVLQNFALDANLSAFFLWVVSGYLIASSNLAVNGALKGVVVSLLVLLPSAVLIGWKEPVSLVPIAVMTLVLGSVLGYLIDRYGK